MWIPKHTRRVARWCAVGAACAGLVASGGALLTPAAARAAETAGADLRSMQDQLRALQDQIEAQQQQLDAQRRQLEGAGLEEAGARSRLSSFLEQTEFNGWVAASYVINSRNSGNNGLAGQNAAPLAYPFHPDSNTFSVDQVWFAMDKAPTEESRAGYHVDLVLGKTAETLNNIYFGTGRSLGGDFVKLYTAYVSYLAPIGNGVQLDFGKLGTLLGAEVAQSPDNFNITRGLVYGLQPITHTGIIASTELGGGFALAGGVVNDVFSDRITDNNKNKTLTGQVSWSNDAFYAGASVIWGATTMANESPKTGVADLLLTWDPSDRVSLWLNYDYVWNQGGGGQQFTSAHGLAVAGRVAVLERTGIAIRAEGVWEDHGNTTNTAAGLASAVGLGGHGAIYSLTGTIDHKLTDNLMLRGEARYDWANAFNTTPDNVFFNSNGGATRDDQGVFLVEAIYTF